MLKEESITEQFLNLADEKRIRVKIGFAYGSEAGRVRKLLQEIASNEPGVSPRHKPRVRFRTISYRSMDFELLCWVESPERKKSIAQMLNQSIYKTFMGNNSNHQVMYTILS